MFILGLGQCSFKEGGVAFSGYGLGARFQDQQWGRSEGKQHIGRVRRVDRRGSLSQLLFLSRGFEQCYSSAKALQGRTQTQGSRLGPVCKAPEVPQGLW